MGGFGIHAEGCRGDAASISFGGNERGIVDASDDATVPIALENTLAKVTQMGWGALEVNEGGGTRRGELHGHWGRRGALGLEWGEKALKEVAGYASECGKNDATGSGSVAVPGTGDREDRFERAGYNIRSVIAKQAVENHTHQVDATSLG